MQKFEFDGLGGLKFRAKLIHLVVDAVMLVTHCRVGNGAVRDRWCLIVVVVVVVAVVVVVKQAPSVCQSVSTFLSYDYASFIMSRKVSFFLSRVTSSDTPVRKLKGSEN